MEEKLPYAFYVSDNELVVQLGSYLQKNKVSVEKAITIVYQPQAVFRIRPVTRCSSTIANCDTPAPPALLMYHRRSKAPAEP
ncbi:Notchless protein 1 [Orobanche hederae]